MLHVGDIQVHLLNDGFTRVDPGGAFGLVPRVLYSKYLEPDADHLVPMCLNSLLVQVNDQNIVVDTGLGDKMDEKGRRRWNLERPQGGLIDGLARLGIAPEDVDMVIDTHLHVDHCGGNTRYADDGQTIVPTFSNAEYVVQRREYEDASHPNERTTATYFSENWDVLIKNGQMRLLDGDTELAPGVIGVLTPGHTPGHMSVRLESGGQHMAFLCDMATYAVHFEKLAWMTAYDVEPLVTLETKRVWQKWAFDTGATLIFPHDTRRPVGKLGMDERGRYRLEPIDEPYV